MRGFVAFLISLFVATHAAAQQKADIQIGLSSPTVEISSNFTGANIVIFGSIENGDTALLAEKKYDVVVVLAGPREEVVIRRKERKFGIWVNGQSLRFGDVPASYSVATTRPLSEIADSGDAKILQIGLENINVIPDVKQNPVADVGTFRDSLSRLKVQQNLFLERIGGVEFLSPTLFKATVRVPANVPIGKHTARAFLFQEGKFINSQFAEMQVKKIGFEQFTYDMAHNNGLLFGIIAVLIAIATGWLASVIFRKD